MESCLLNSTVPLMNLLPTRRALLSVKSSHPTTGPSKFSGGNPAKALIIMNMKESSSHFRRWNQKMFDMFA